MLPNFLGIGASRSGSTWLDKQLRTHPDIYMPIKRKEVSFFNVYYELGITWYEGFFPGISEASAFKAIGEFSPGYLSDESVPERIKESLGEIKLLAILRNPADRAYSQWKLRVQKRAENRSFEDFVKNDEEPIKLGLYGSHIERYHKEFSKD